MKKQIVILGGGTGGTMTANRLRRHFDADEAEIHVVDRDDLHVYQPGLLFVPFGLSRIVAIGARLLPEETDGLTSDGWNERVFTFYTPDGAEQLQRVLDWFDGGRLV